MRLWPGSMMALPVLTSLTPACNRHDAGNDAGAAPLPSAAESAAVAPPAPSSASGALDGAASIHCESDPTFPTLLDLPEASAAAEVEIRPGVRELIVVADSDRRGAALAYALPDGPARKLTLPIDLGVTDDVEGIAWRAGHLYALVSTGFVERFTPAGDQLTRAG